MYCNFVGIHRSLRGTPAMVAGVFDHIWSVEDIAKPGNKKAGLLTFLEIFEVLFSRHSRGTHKSKDTVSVDFFIFRYALQGVSTRF